MPIEKLTRFLLLPKLEFVNLEHSAKGKLYFKCKSISTSDFCRKCGLENSRVHDYRTVRIKDAPQSGRKKTLVIRKKRYRCGGCKSVFTEDIPGILRGGRITQRLQRHVLYVCQNFANLKGVRRDTGLGSGTIYKRHYDQLELEQKKRMNNPWPTTIGIDEHSFIRNKKYGYREFVTMIVDYNNKRVKEVIPGRVSGQLQQALRHIQGRNNVKNVCMDLSGVYRSFAKDFFPNARIIADKFHVLRLLNPHINRYRKKITGDKRKLKIRKFLLMSSKKLEPKIRYELFKWLDQYPALKELYMAKEALMQLYRCQSTNHAKRLLIKLTDWMATSKVKEIKTLRRTLMSWSEEILNYFENRLTNARTEGYNLVAKQVQRRAYGYRNFKNYRLKLLYACS